MKIEHIAIWVKDLEKMKNFYEKYFKASANEIYHNNKKSFHSYFLTFEGGSRLELMHKPLISDHEIPSATEHLGITHMAISTGSKEGVQALTEDIRDAGYTIIGEPRTTGDGYYESVILDPENNRIEITI